jgi:KaiC/GvpD/RAD55 family RecA-like ATPase
MRVRRSCEEIIVPIDIFSVDELLQQEFPTTDSILGNGLIDRGGAILISGPQKIGKSLFGTQLALSLAARTGFLGFLVGAADYRTLILQAEVGARRMKERFQKQVAGFAAEARGRVLSASVFSSVKLDSKEGADAVMAWVDEHQPDLLVVDPLANFHTGDENVAKDVLRVTHALDTIRHKGVAVAMVHHHGKGSADRQNVGHKARGSSVLPGWYDSHFSLEWATPGSTVRLKFELRHDEAPEDVVLKLNRDTLLFEAQTDEASQVSLVVSVVRDLGPSDAEQVRAYCKRTRQWASQWLNFAVEEGKLVRTGNRPVLFSLPDQQPPMTRVEVPAPGGQHIVVTTNTGQYGGVQVEDAQEERTG